MKCTILLAAALLAAGCSSLYQTTDEQMRKMLGQPVSNLIKKWGTPVDKRVIGGKRLMTFRTDAAGAVPEDAAAMPPGSYCDSTVEVDSRDVVIGYYWDGAHCEAAAHRL